MSHPSTWQSLTVCHTTHNRVPHVSHILMCRYLLHMCVTPSYMSLYVWLYCHTSLMCVSVSLHHKRLSHDNQQTVTRVTHSYVSMPPSQVCHTFLRATWLYCHMSLMCVSVSLPSHDSYVCHGLTTVPWLLCVSVSHHCPMTLVCVTGSLLSHSTVTCMKTYTHICMKTYTRVWHVIPVHGPKVV